MFSLRDFYHLPQLDTWVERLVEGGEGLAVVAGLDARPGVTDGALPAGLQPAAGLLPSGRSAILSILIDLFLTRRPDATCIVIGEKDRTPKVPRQFRRRMHILPVDPPYSYAGSIEAALKDRPGLLALDRLDRETIGPALEAAAQGLFILAPLDSVFYGAEVARHLLSLGAASDRLTALRWVLGVQRLHTLCPNCKQPAQPGEMQQYRLRMHASRFSGLDGFSDLAEACSSPENLELYRPGSCANCGGSGRSGEVTVFDVFYHPLDDGGRGAGLPENSVLPMEAYVGKLALHGRLALDDFIDFEADQRRRIGYSLLSRDAALTQSAAENERRVTELEAAYRVLQERTRSLVSLQEIGMALISSAGLHDLANRACRIVQDLCGADRVIVYYLHADDDAETLAFGGWAEDRVPKRCDPSEVFASRSLRPQQAGPDAESAGAGNTEPAPYNGWPPGIPRRHPDLEGAELRAGIYAPLIAQGKRVGFILAHTIRKPAFAPKEISLLKTLSQQVALGIQRTRLVDDLRDKIDRLEAAQAELRRKERLERDMELARQVQQSMLPREFPQIPGYRFAARNEPARQVGGDFYDVIPLDEGHFGVAMADVSDKGLPAALYMALARSLLRAEARRQSSPRTVLDSVNRLLLELGDGRSFITLFYGVVERSTGRLIYSRAGHERPLLIRAAGQAEFLGGDGTPLGILDHNFRLSEEQVHLAPGDRLALYTDGLTDVSDPTGDLFGLDRLAALLQTYPALPLDEMCVHLFADLLAYQGETEQFDDMSVLLVEVA